MTLDENYNLIVVNPKSREDIANLALRFRRKLGIAENAPYVDVMRILEFSLPSKLDDFDFHVPEEWHREEEAYYDTQQGMVFIRADVYDKAADDDGRARFTIMHEIAHYVLFRTWSAPHTMPLADIANIDDATLQSMDPEWQANTFAGAVLCKPDIIRNMEIYDIETQCKVSEAAAEVAYCHSRGIPYDWYALPMDDFSDWSWHFAMSGGMSQLWDEIEQGGERA